MLIKDTLNINPYEFDEDVENDLDKESLEDLMWELEELNKDYKFGTQSWDI